MKQEQQQQQQQQQITTPKVLMAKNSIFILSAIFLVVASALLASEANAMNLADQLETSTSGKPSLTLAVIENPEVTARVLENLLRSILYSANVETIQSSGLAQKRGLDLGISRGFSGSQAGKHLMGLSAASFANGPGRR